MKRFYYYLSLHISKIYCIITAYNSYFFYFTLCVIFQHLIYYNMSEFHQQRQITNQTATFNKISNQSSIKLPTDLSSIKEQSIKEQGDSFAMPQPLIKTSLADPKEEFRNSQSRHQSSVLANYPTKMQNVTFYPSYANRLLYEQTDLESLKQQQKKLKGELMGLNEMISDLLNKKHEVLNEYEQIIRQKKGMQKVKRNLQQEYQSYLFMLDGDYCLKLDKEMEKDKQTLVKLRKEVHRMDVQLSKPTFNYNNPSEEQIMPQEKQLIDLQISIDKLQSSNRKKEEKFALLKSQNEQKQKDLKEITRKIDTIQDENEGQEWMDPKTMKQNFEKYEQLNKRLGKMKKIRDQAQKIKQIQFYRKLKETKEIQLSNKTIQQQIAQVEQKTYFKLIELQASRKDQLINSTTKKPKSTIKPIENFNKRTTTAYKQVARPFLSEKNRLTIQPYLTTKAQDSSKSLARIKTEIQDLQQDRPQLQMRKRRIYTQLQKNLYFKNIENSQNQKISRIVDFDSKSQISITQISKQNELKKIKFPEIQQRQLNKQQNDSIVYSFKDRPSRILNKKSIDLHNKRMKEIRGGRKMLNQNNQNYKQLCKALNKDSLLIEQECQFDIGELIYNSRY